MALSVEETEELIDDLNEYANSSVKVLEQAVVLVSRTKDGENVIQFPLTRLRQIEDIKDLPLEDGGLEWDDNMKLYVEASDLLQDGGGLTTDDNGDIYVDFSLMPTDKFEDLLKTLTIPIYLDENLYQYVDCNNGDDTIEDGRGSEDMPWKTISACADYCTTYYNVNSHYIEIRVLAGTYDEGEIELGDFSRTTGYIDITSYSGVGEAIVTGENNSAFHVTGGTWYLSGLAIRVVANDDDTTSSHESFSCIRTDGGETEVQVYACQLYGALDGEFPYATRNIYLLWAGSKSTISLRQSTLGNTSLEFHVGNGNALIVLNVTDSATLYLYKSATNGISEVYCSGEATEFAGASHLGFLTCTGTGNQLQFVVKDGDAVTGYRYHAYSGGIINPSDDTDDDSYFPGDTDGRVDTATYSWYA